MIRALDLFRTQIGKHRIFCDMQYSAGGPRVCNRADMMVRLRRIQGARRSCKDRALYITQLRGLEIPLKAAIRILENGDDRFDLKVEANLFMRYRRRKLGY